MEKYFVVFGVLITSVIITIIFGKIIGPKLLDWLSPSFNKATNKLDDKIMGPSNEWETKIREIIETNPEQLKHRVVEVLLRFATPRSGASQALVWLPPSPRDFFQKYTHLSFDGHTQILDAMAVRKVTHKGKAYAVIGRSEDEGHFYAIDLQDERSIVRLEMDDNGQVFSLEEDAPSFEHFVTLQHELHLKSI